MAALEPDTDELIRLAADGNPSAMRQLLFRHRDRLRQMVTVRMDPRLMARFDPSDVIQEVFMDASRRLPTYFNNPSLPFYPWLRQLAWNRLVDLHRRHIHAQKRTVTREQPWDLPLSDRSAMQLASQLVAGGASPSSQALRQELRQRVQAAMDALPPSQREVLVMRHLEQLSVSEIAAVLEIAEGTVKSRHFRALEHLQKLLRDDPARGAR